jgi:DNA ligase-1
MSKGLQPMLAAKLEPEDLARLQLPLFLSPKLDGIRLRIDPELGAVSRTHKPIPNQYIQSIVREHMSWMKFMDGEIIVGDITAPDVFNKTQSAVMTASEEPKFNYLVFDHWFHGETGYDLRLDHLTDIVHVNFDKLMESGNDVECLPQTIVRSIAEIEELEALYISQGYEGVILRSLRGKYKNGRSTIKEQHLMKLKRFQDAEAKVVGFEPLERNQNAAVKDVFGHQKRSSHKAGKVVDELLGNLIVEHETFGRFSIGSGFDVDTRTKIWQDKDRYLGQVVTFKYQTQGMKDKPRFPIFKGFRHD